MPKLCWWIGFSLVGGIFAPHNMILRRMKQTAYKSQPFDWSVNGKFNLPIEYLKMCAQYGWSPWPVYSMVLMLLTGVGFILLGLRWPS